MAMSAPTPVSALVHSRTLVTSGFILLLKFNISGSFLLYRRVITLVVVGILSIVERDLKKVVALSTLRQLGLIGVAMRMGLPRLAFFHLVVHAFTKSTMFIRVGIWIMSNTGVQDQRGITISAIMSPYSFFCIRMCSLSLLGILYTSGRSSKEMILLFCPRASY
jgi:NADH-quinone oxidoreductase subunit L